MIIHGGAWNIPDQCEKAHLDAIIVDGKTIDFGAVAGVRDIMHPVSLARKIIEETEHSFLVGQELLNLRRNQG